MGGFNLAARWASLFFLSSFLMTWDAAGQTPDVSAEVGKRVVSRFEVTASAATGVGLFQDIQVPINQYAELRGDGQVIGEENADHYGIPLMATLGFRNRTGRLIYDAHFEGLLIRATSGPPETLSSSYSRLGVGGGLKWRSRVAGLLLTVGGDVGVRRSVFENISSGHYIESVLSGIHLGLARQRSWRLILQGAVAPVASFGYATEPGWGGEPFKKCSTSLQEWSLSSLFHLDGRTWLDLGIESELAQVTLSDLNEYNGFGLSVTPSPRETRRYNLVTTVARIGLSKSF